MIASYYINDATKNVGAFAGWVAKLGVFGIILMWAWTNGLQPLLKKLGVF